MSRIIGILIALTVLTLLDLYAFQAIKTLFPNSGVAKRILSISYWALTPTFILLMIYVSVLNARAMEGIMMYVMALFIIIFVSKLVISGFVLVTDIIRGIQYLVQALSSQSPVEGTGTGISRSIFIQRMGLIMGGLTIGTFIMGMVKWGYDYTVRNVNLVLPNLPGSFVGLKILQISDLHVGSFRNVNPVKEIVKIIQDQNADVIFFTGDLVNNRTSEVTDFVEELSKLSAPMGVYSVLGNHDYGDYYTWHSAEAKEENFREMIKVHQKLGWRLLLNENIRLKKGNDEIAVIGVENISGTKMMNTYGKLVPAMEGAEDAPVKLLLSHDPSHWNSEVTKKFKDIDVAFAGHTHGMQFGVEIPGFKWSPIQYIYKEWAGLYKNENQQLYVNRGIGFLGYPGRVGILPEITMFELKLS